MPSPTHSVESPLPLFSFFTPSVYVRKSPAAWKSQAYNRLLTHKQARSPATGLDSWAISLSILFIDLGNTPTLDVLGRNVLSRGQALGLDHCSAQALVRVYPPLAAYACLCAQPDIGRLTQASAPLGAMASRSMECCPAPLVLASNSPVGSREVFTISLPEILHRRAALRLVPPPTAHDLYS